MNERTRNAWSRREFAATAAGFLGAAVLPGCPGPDDTGEPDPDDSDLPENEWATGGTAAMAADYPDPFDDDPDTCALACAMTLGPCYAETLDRRDVSEGVTGLPMRLALRVVDDACAPVAGAVVDIWHTSPSGLYSGDDAASMCTTGDEEAEAARWFRGTQTTDADGKVAFHSCYPGWYRGRTIHIHFQVRLSDDAYVTSQLFFDQALTDEIFAAHPEYVAFGTPDTTNEEDGIWSAEQADTLTCRTARLDDGVMHAWQTIAIRSSLADPLCTA